jgi:AraC-like DNA-binding protein
MLRSPRGRLPLARFPVIDTRDPDLAHQAAIRLFAPNEMSLPRGARGFRAVLHHHKLDALSLYYIRYEPEVIIGSAPMRRFYLVLRPLAGRCVVKQGDERMTLAPGRLGVVNPVTPIELHWSGNCAQLVVKVARAALDRVLHEYGAIGAVRPLVFAPRPLTHSSCPTLMRMIDLLIGDLEEASPSVSSRWAERAAETLFLHTLLRQVPHDRSATLDRPASRAAPYYVRRVEEFIRLNASAPIRVSDMVAVSGVSARALFKGFREFRGLGPKAYLHAVRLEHARQELLTRGDARSVAEIAEASGLAHPGRFALAYRRRFGESPSATRRRNG